MMKEELFKIQRLCFKYGRINLADWVSQSLELYCLDRPNFFARLESLDWWGNFSDLCDLHLFAPDGSISLAEYLEDNKALRRSLIVIYEEMAKAGREPPAIRQVMQTFRSQPETDLLKKWKPKQ